MIQEMKDFILIVRSKSRTGDGIIWSEVARKNVKKLRDKWGKFYEDQNKEQNK